MKTPLLAWLLMLALCPVLQATTTFYISPTGNDSNPGSLELPFQTLTKARNTVRSIPKTATQDILIILRGGTYSLDVPFTLIAKDSGSKGHPVIYKNHPGETPIISAGKRITVWKSGVSNIWSASTPVADFRQLYVNGVRRPRAHGNPPPDLELVSDAGYKTSLASMAHWKNPGAMELVYFDVWCNTRCRIKSIRPEENGAFIDMLPSYFEYARIKEGAKLNEPSTLENAFELLDEPGEWYLDASTKKVHYMPFPDEDMSRAEVMVPGLDRLIELTGTLAQPIHDIAFEGITFSHAGWLLPNSIGHIDVQANFTLNLTNMLLREGGITDIHNEHKKSPANIICHTAKSIRFENCRFTHLGGAGIDLEDGSQDNTIINCEFSDISGSAIQVGDVCSNDHHPRDPRHIVKNNTIIHNDIHDIAVEYKGGVGVFVGYTDGTRIINNHFHDLPYSAVSMGWGWGEEDAGGGNPTYRQPFLYKTPTPSSNNQILSNHIHHVMTQLNDGGAIYTLGNMPGTLIGWNHLHDNPGVPGGIYLDEGSGFIAVTSNLVYGVKTPLFFNNEVQDRKNTCNIHDNYLDIPIDDNLPEPAQKIFRNAGMPPP